MACRFLFSPLFYEEEARKAIKKCKYSAAELVRDFQRMVLLPLFCEYFSHDSCFCLA